MRGTDIPQAVVLCSGIQDGRSTRAVFSKGGAQEHIVANDLHLVILPVVEVRCFSTLQFNDVFPQRVFGIFHEEVQSPLQSIPGRKEAGFDTGWLGAYLVCQSAYVIPVHRLDRTVHLVEFFAPVSGGLQDVFGNGLPEYLLEFWFRGADGLIEQGIDHISEEGGLSGLLRHKFFNEELEGFGPVALKAFCQMRDIYQQIGFYDNPGKRSGYIAVIPSLRFSKLK